MTHSVLIEREPEGYRATALGIPDAAATARTRQDAIRILTRELTSRLAQAEIIQVEVPEPHGGALAATIGLLADDPELARQICAEAYAARDAEDDPEA